MKNAIMGGGSPDSDTYYEGDDVIEAVGRFRDKLEEYGNDYLITYFDYVFGKYRK